MIFESNFLHHSFYFIIFLQLVLTDPTTNGVDDTDPIQHDLSSLTFPPDYFLFYCRLSDNMNRLSMHRKSKETMKHIRREIYLLQSSKFAMNTLMEIVSELAQTVNNKTARIAILTLSETLSNILGKLTIRNFLYLWDYYKVLKARPGLLKALNRVIQESVNIFRDPLRRRLLMALLNIQTNEVGDREETGSTIKSESTEKVNTQPELGEVNGRKIQNDTSNKKLKKKERGTQLERNLNLEGLPSTTLEDQIDQISNYPSEKDGNMNHEENENLETNDFDSENQSNYNQENNSLILPESTNVSDSKHYSEIESNQKDEKRKNIEEETNSSNNERITDSDDTLQKPFGKIEEKLEMDEIEVNEIMRDLQEPAIVSAERTNLHDSSRYIKSEHPSTSSEFINEKEETSNAVNIERSRKDADVEENISAITNIDQEDDKSSSHKSKQIEPNDPKTEENVENYQIDETGNEKVEPIIEDVTPERSKTDIHVTNEQEQTNDLETTLIDLNTDSDIVTLKEISSKEIYNDKSTMSENVKENTSEAIIMNEENYIDQSLMEGIPPKRILNESAENTNSNLRMSSFDQETTDHVEESMHKPMAPIKSSVSNNISSPSTAENPLDKPITHTTNDAMEDIMSKEIDTNEELVQNKDNISAGIINENEDNIDTTVTVQKHPSKEKKPTKTVPKKTNKTINENLHVNEEQKDFERGLDSTEIKEEVRDDAIVNQDDENASNGQIDEEKKFDEYSNNDHISLEALPNSNERSIKKGHQEGVINIQNNEEKSNSVSNPINEEISMARKDVEVRSEMIHADIEYKKYTSEEINEVMKQPLDSQNEYKKDEANQSNYSNTSDNSKNTEEVLMDSTTNRPTEYTHGDKEYEHNYQDLNSINADETLTNRPEQLTERASIKLTKQSEEKTFSDSSIESNVDVHEDIPNIVVGEELFISSTELDKPVDVKESIGSTSSMDHSNEENAKKMLKHESSAGIEIKTIVSTTKSEETIKNIEENNILTNDEDQASASRVSQSSERKEDEVFDDTSKPRRVSSEIEEKSESHAGPEQFALHDLENILATPTEPDPRDPHNTPLEEANHEMMTESSVSMNQGTLDKTVAPNKDDGKISNDEKQLETEQETSDLATLFNDEFDEEELDSDSEYEQDIQTSSESSVLGQLDEDEDDSGLEDNNNLHSTEEGTIDVESEEIESTITNPKFTSSEGYIEVKDSINANTEAIKIKNEHDSQNDDETHLAEHERGQEPKNFISTPIEDTSASLQQSSILPRNSDSINSNNSITLKEEIVIPKAADSHEESYVDEDISKNSSQSITPSENNNTDPLGSKIPDEIVTKEKEDTDINSETELVDNKQLEGLRKPDQSKVVPSGVSPDYLKQPVASIESSGFNNYPETLLATADDLHYELRTDSGTGIESEKLKEVHSETPKSLKSQNGERDEFNNEGTVETENNSQKPVISMKDYHSNNIPETLPTNNVSDSEIYNIGKNLQEVHSRTPVDMKPEKREKDSSNNEDISEIRELQNIKYIHDSVENFRDGIKTSSDSSIENIENLEIEGKKDSGILEENLKVESVSSLHKSLDEYNAEKTENNEDLDDYSDHICRQPNTAEQELNLKKDTSTMQENHEKMPLTKVDLVNNQYEENGDVTQKENTSSKSTGKKSEDETIQKIIEPTNDKSLNVEKLKEVHSESPRSLKSLNGDRDEFNNEGTAETENDSQKPIISMKDLDSNNIPETSHTNDDSNFERMTDLEVYNAGEKLQEVHSKAPVNLEPQKGKKDSSNHEDISEMKELQNIEYIHDSAENFREDIKTSSDSNTENIDNLEIGGKKDSGILEENLKVESVSSLHKSLDEYNAEKTEKNEDLANYSDHTCRQPNTAEQELNLKKDTSTMQENHEKMPLTKVDLVNNQYEENGDSTQKENTSSKSTGKKSEGETIQKIIEPTNDKSLNVEKLKLQDESVPMNDVENPEIEMIETEKEIKETETKDESVPSNDVQNPKIEMIEMEKEIKETGTNLKTHTTEDAYETATEVETDSVPPKSTETETEFMKVCSIMKDNGNNQAENPAVEKKDEKVDQNREQSSHQIINTETQIGKKAENYEEPPGSTNENSAPPKKETFSIKKFLKLW